MDSHSLFDQLKGLSTEQRNPASMDIATRSTREILTIINDEDKKVAYAVEKEISVITQTVELVVAALKNGGRLIYCGAGTSGRLGVLDAAECPPTFGTKPEMIVGKIAGGDKAMFQAQEGAEDKEENGIVDIDGLNVNQNDVVFGIAASLRTPYVVGAVKRAKQLGARTVYITTNARATFDAPEFSDLKNAIDISICPETGPEVIMGSTRMKSGTAQKLILNMITTASMIRLGKVYENMMIDLQLTNKKLIERAKRIIMLSTDVDYQKADSSLNEAGGHVKTAIVMIKRNVSRETALALLRASEGFVHEAIRKS